MNERSDFGGGIRHMFKRLAQRLAISSLNTKHTLK